MCIQLLSTVPTSLRESASPSPRTPTSHPLLLPVENSSLNRAPLLTGGSAHGTLLGTQPAESPFVGTGASGRAGIHCSQASSFLGAEEVPGTATWTGLPARPESPDRVLCR